MFRSLQYKLGPGLLFAASAVGVSHLIQATRGGAVYGSSMLLIILVICLLKYPLFMFGAHYTAVTGDTILDGYRKLGKWILGIIFLVYVFELPFAIAGISVVSASILSSSLGLGLEDTSGALLLLLVCLSLTAFGHYRLIEKVSRVLVALFLVCIIIGTSVAVVGNTNHYSLELQAVTLDVESMPFLVALAGWMPAGVGGALGMSLWIHAKNRRLGHNLNLKEVMFDFNFSYAIVIVTAFCFSLLGSYTLTTSLDAWDESSISFTRQLFAVITQAFPPWVHFLIIVGTNVVMLSSLLVVVDLLPRLGSMLLQTFYGARLTEVARSQIILGFILYELVSVCLIILLLFRSFTTFVDMVVSLGFLAAPAIAWLNHKVVFGGDLQDWQQPSTLMRYWNLAAICLLLVVSLVYVMIKMLAVY